MMIERRGILKVLSLTLLFSMMLVACSKDDDPKPVGVPSLNAATDINTTSFKASWNGVTGAEKYLLDVSLKADFSTTVTGYSRKEITGTSTVVTGLTAATKYYFRVYAKKGSVLSSSSTVKEATTL
ncbi:MAG: fibronectin type III domain-containing protein [Cyclobacteriaceae bacterium]|nr:fibronectin type III domain-containing protein [Cyclobacteriaceae bacterium]